MERTIGTALVHLLSSLLADRQDKAGARWLCGFHFLLDQQCKDGTTVQISHPDTSFWNQTFETLE